MYSWFYGYKQKKKNPLAHFDLSVVGFWDICDVGMITIKRNVLQEKPIHKTQSRLELSHPLIIWLNWREPGSRSLQRIFQIPGSKPFQLLPLSESTPFSPSSFHLRRNHRGLTVH